MDIGYDTVLVHTSEIPVLKFAHTVELFKVSVELVYAVGFAGAEQHCAFYNGGRLVGYDEIHIAIDLVNGLCPFLQARQGWAFLPSTGNVLGSHFAVGAFSAAEGEYATPSMVNICPLII